MPKVPIAYTGHREDRKISLPTRSCHAYHDHRDHEWFHEWFLPRRRHQRQEKKIVQQLHEIGIKCQSTKRIPKANLEKLQAYSRHAKNRDEVEGFAGSMEEFDKMMLHWEVMRTDAVLPVPVTVEGKRCKVGERRYGLLIGISWLLLEHTGFPVLSVVLSTGHQGVQRLMALPIFHQTSPFWFNPFAEQ